MELSQRTLWGTRMNIRSLGMPWTTVFTCSTTEAFCPVTQWMDPAELQKMRATLELQNLCGNIEVSVGYQLADVENNPLSDEKLESYNGPTGWQSTTGVHYPERWDGSIESQAGGKQLIRFGFVVKLSSGTDPGMVRAAAKVEIYTC